MFLIADYTLIVYSKTYRAKQLPDVERSNCPEKKRPNLMLSADFFLMTVLQLKQNHSRRPAEDDRG